MYTLGIDIGSTATKAVVLKNGKDIYASAIISFGAGTSGTDQALEKLFEDGNLAWDEIDYTVATGYGRLHFDEADKQISELSCHACGMHFMIPEARTIIDIGGQDVKALRLNERGGLDNFIMNEKCAAGTGRFLDVMAACSRPQLISWARLMLKRILGSRSARHARSLQSRRSYRIWPTRKRSRTLLRASMTRLRNERQVWHAGLALKRRWS